MNLETRHCALCGPDAGKKELYPASFRTDDLNAAVFSARRMPDRRHFRLVECETCGIVYSDPACEPSLLSALYHQSGVNYGAQEEQIFDSYSPILEPALGRLASRGTFLEIGGGTGFMLRFGEKHGFARSIEIEPSADAEKKFKALSPRTTFVRGVFKRGILPPRSVSLAAFFQMLDHVPDPREFLEAVYQVLEPGGVAVCVTHDTAALSARILGRRSPIYDIEHTYLFNKRNLPRLFEKAGFTGVECFPVANRYALRYWLRLAPLPRLFKAPFLSALEATRLAGLRLNVRAGNFAVIAVKPASGA